MTTRTRYAAVGICFLAIAAILIATQLSKRSQTSKIELPDAPPSVVHKSPSQVALANLTAFDWQTIESSDYREYIKNLRSIGTPEETIRDIIIADVGKLFELRWKEMLKTYPSPPGAEVSISPVTAVKNRLKEDAQKLHAEKKSLIKELLGDDVVLKDEPFEVPMADVQQVLLRFLPSEKQESTHRLVRAFDERFQHEIGPLLDGPFNEQERATYLKFKAEKDEALKQMLTTAEKEQFDLRFSQLSSFLHHQFQNNQLSESAFQELYRFAQQYANDLDFYLLDHGDKNRTKANVDAQIAINQRAQELSHGPAPTKVGGRMAEKFGF